MMISDEDEEVKAGWSYCTAPTVVAMVKLFRLCFVHRTSASEFGRNAECGSQKERANETGPRKIGPRDKITPLDFTCDQDHVNNLGRQLLVFHVWSLLPLKKHSVLVANLLYRQNVHRSVYTALTHAEIKAID